MASRLVIVLLQMYLKNKNKTRNITIKQCFSKIRLRTLLEKSASKECSTCVSKKSNIVQRKENLLVTNALLTILFVTLILVTIGKIN